MTIVEIVEAWQQQRLCEFYSKGAGWFPGEGWYAAIIEDVNVDAMLVSLRVPFEGILNHGILLKVQGQEEIKQVLREKAGVTY